MPCPHSKRIHEEPGQIFGLCEELSDWAGWDCWIPDGMDCQSPEVKIRVLIRRIMLWDKPLRDPILGSLDNTVRRLCEIAFAETVADALCKAVEECLDLQEATAIAAKYLATQDDLPERMKKAAMKCRLTNLPMIRVYADASCIGKPIAVLQRQLPENLEVGIPQYWLPYGWIIADYGGQPALPHAAKLS